MGIGLLDLQVPLGFILGQLHTYGVLQKALLLAFLPGASSVVWVGQELLWQNGHPVSQRIGFQDLDHFLYLLIDALVGFHGLLDFLDHFGRRSRRGFHTNLWWLLAKQKKLLLPCFSMEIHFVGMTV